MFGDPSQVTSTIIKRDRVATGKLYEQLNWQVTEFGRTPSETLSSR